MKKGSICALLLTAITAFTSTAQGVTSPSFFTYENTSIVKSFSHNGKWGVFENRVEDATDNGGYVFNVEEKTFTPVVSSVVVDDKGNPITDNGIANHITDDGNIIGGSYRDYPAYWNKTTGVWTILPMPTGAVSGEVSRLSADGHYGVGQCWLGEYPHCAVIWDLTTGTIVETPGLISLDMSHTDHGQNRFVDVSADGRYVCGMMSVSYLYALVAYVYDRETATYDVIGFTESTTEAWIPKAPNIAHIETMTMSPNGYWITGTAYMDNVSTDTEYETCYRYNVLDKTFELYDGSSDAGFCGKAITDSGVVYGATPYVSSPLRDMYVRRGNYWFGMEQILSQRYGIDFEATTGISQTGTPIGISPDGRIIGTFYSPSEGNGVVYYFNEDLVDACAAVDLLGEYQISPAAGSIFSSVSNVEISFDRNVAAVGEIRRKAELRDKDGNVVKNSMGIGVDGSKVTLVFAPYAFNAGEEYTVVLPAGVLSINGDAEVTNREISVKYVGRSNAPVSYISAYPTPETGISKLDYSSSHILLNFDASLKEVDGMKAKIYRNEETDAFDELSIAVTGNQMELYPLTTLYLFQGNTYRVEIPAGAVTDIGGTGGNEAITLNYKGSYEREISSDDITLFSENFNEGLGAQFMFYEGDNNVPTTAMTEFGFTQSSTPWWVARDNTGSSDYAAMSHSSYTPAGTSDDWMVIPSLYIPDENCRLTFDGQGYSKTKSDRLNVYVIESEKVYTELGADAIADFKENRKLVFSEVMDPGASQGSIDDEWTSYEVSLADYAGKEVYIAFVNENIDQSILFVDNVNVVHDMRYTVTFYNESTVVGTDDVTVNGRVSVVSDFAEYGKAHLQLCDSEGRVVSEISEEGLSVNRNNPYDFTFPENLPLVIGKENSYSVKIAMDDESTEIAGKIKDLAFNPVKRILLEEYSGAKCGNCPLGILAIEKLERDFGDQFIPVCIRSYGGDVLGSVFSSYTEYLGLYNVGAPSAMINRNGVQSFPMTSTADGYTFFAPEGSSPQWCDIVNEELSVPAEAEINIEAYTTDDSDSVIEIPMDIRYAMDSEDLNVSVLFFVLEDHCYTEQYNYLYNTTDPLLGEWQKGGIYSSPKVAYYVDDVVRSIVGRTFNGTQGYVPSSMPAGEVHSVVEKINMPQSVSDLSRLSVVAVMIDNNTDGVVNAAKATLVTSGVKAVADDSWFSAAVEDGSVVVRSSAKANVALYSVAGELLNTVAGEGDFSVSTNGYSGVVIVKANTDAVAKTVKLLVK
jgi:hypothetical protein